MKADLSRNTFRPQNHYRDVLKQQGRVDVDADWNEQLAINAHRSETAATDVIGPCGAPVLEAGFHIVTAIEHLAEIEKELAGNNVKRESIAPGDFFISAGRMYVDGILCENETLVSFMGMRHDSPSRPTNPIDALKAAKAEFGIVYLDVWLRHITALDDPLIRETALGGPDTATRTKVVWQVKVLPVSADLGGPLNRMTSFPEWDALTQVSTGRLAARTSEAAPTDNLCQLPPSAGYQRLENQLYRVEIHNGSESGPTTFKWSRDNGSIVTLIETTSGHDVIVDNVGPDEVLGFAPGQWVEIVDDEQELNAMPGDLIQIENVIAEARTITMKTTPRAVDRKLHPKLRRWDMSGPTAAASGVAANGRWQPLEDGIEVQFSEGTYKAGDYWLIPARAATGQVEWPPFNPALDPSPQPPLGIQHHYCRLAAIKIKDTTLGRVSDLRHLFYDLVELSNGLVSEVLGRGINGNEIVLRNGDSIAGSDLARGLRVLLNRPIDPAGATAAACFVTLELPFDVEQQVVGYQPVVLAAKIGMEQSCMLNWTPKPSARQYLVSQSLIKSSLLVDDESFETEWDVSLSETTGAKWRYANGNAEATVSLGNPGAFAGFMAINKQPVKGGELSLSMTVDPPSEKRNEFRFVGIVFNFVSINDFWVVAFSAERSVGSTSDLGAQAFLRITHYVNGDRRESAETFPQHIGLEIGAITLDIFPQDPRLFARAQNINGKWTIELPSNLIPLAPNQFLRASRVGLVTNWDGNAAFSNLKMSASETFISARPGRLLSRLTIKRDFLRLVKGAHESDTQEYTLPPPRPDFSMWFWVKPDAPYYQGNLGIGTDLI